MDFEINNHLVDLEFPSPLLCSDSQNFSPSFNLSSSFFSNNFTESQSWDNELLFELPEGEFQYDMNELEQYLCYKADGISTDSISFQKYSTNDFNEASPCSVLSSSQIFMTNASADVMTINIVDFDIDDGVQWAPVIETLSHQKKELTLILVKWASDEYSHCNPDNARKRLISHARSVGAKLNIQEVDIEDLVSEIKKKNKRCAENQWFAFNCMTSLPHMTKSRCTTKVHEFLRVAKDVIGNGKSPKGIITFGNGDTNIKSTTMSNYSSFFESQLVHYQALLKSVECTLSDQFTEAKVAIECLFLSLRISSQEWLQKWENMKEGGNIRAAFALEGLQLSQNTLMEANELIRQGDKSYTLTMGKDVNEIVLYLKFN